MPLSAASYSAEFDPLHGSSGRRIADTRRRLEALARLLDSAVRVPGTDIHIGLDAVLNLVPGIGTLTAKGLAGYLIWEARGLGAPPSVLLRMAGNVGVDLLLSVIPVVGWFGDIFYRANQRNISLLHAYLDAAEHNIARASAERQS
ncbi:DUF4112 domain-containing protein [Ferrovibrio terrae]|uniref:DUF4112 domain-containing protein n=1 Tax=Ferrovibrio terrae TaxID=2594003 RepID=UPI003137A935